MSDPGYRDNVAAAAPIVAAMGFADDVASWLETDQARRIYEDWCEDEGYEPDDEGFDEWADAHGEAEYQHVLDEARGDYLISLAEDRMREEGRW